MFRIGVPASRQKNSEREMGAMNEERFVIVVKPDGWHGLVHCFPGNTLPLKNLQDMIGGNIETVPTVLGEGWSKEEDVKVLMLKNEEGKLQGLPVNQIATDLSALWNDVVVGNAVILGARGDEMIGLTREAAENIVKKWMED